MKQKKSRVHPIGYGCQFSATLFGIYCTLPFLQLEMVILDTFC